MIASLFVFCFIGAFVFGVLAAIGGPWWLPVVGGLVAAIVGTFWLGYSGRLYPRRRSR